jgi:hypothetical protein
MISPESNENIPHFRLKSVLILNLFNSFPEPLLPHTSHHSKMLNGVGVLSNSANTSKTSTSTTEQSSHSRESGFQSATSLNSLTEQHQNQMLMSSSGAGATNSMRLGGGDRQSRNGDEENSPASTITGTGFIYILR